MLDEKRIQGISQRWQKKVYRVLSDISDLYGIPELIEKNKFIAVFADKDGNMPSVEEIEGICSDVWVNGMMVNICFDHPEIEFRKGTAKKDVEKVERYLEELGYEIA